MANLTERSLTSIDLQVGRNQDTGEIDAWSTNIQQFETENITQRVETRNLRKLLAVHNSHSLHHYTAGKIWLQYLHKIILHKHEYRNVHYIVFIMSEKNLIWSV
jgi:hypothetical protein